MSLPAVVVLDVNETLSDLAPLGRRLADLGVPRALAGQWFAAVLRDGFALTVTGSPARFADLAASSARTLLAGRVLDRPVEDAVRHLLDGFGALTVHPDVVPGLRALAALGVRVVTLSNGSAAVAHGLLERAAAQDLVEAVLSVEDAGVWKPARGAYHYAAGVCAVDPTSMMLVAVHPWDLHGASLAGLRTAWIDRAGTPYPSAFTAPDVTATSLLDLAGVLGRLG